MSSRKFRRNVKAVSKNLADHTKAMEGDLQLLINSMLEIIQSKLVALRKLVKLKICIRNVKCMDSLERIVAQEERSDTYTISKHSDSKKEGHVNGSLEDLSSIAYGHASSTSGGAKPPHNSDKKSITADDSPTSNDLEKLCCELNQQNNNSGDLHDDGPHNTNKGNKTNVEISRSHNGDCEDSAKQKKMKEQSKSSVILLSRSEYESIIDILNSVLDAYKKQDERESRSNTRNLDKSKTEPYVHKLQLNNERKTLSDSICDKKESTKKDKNKTGRGL
ncbi:hypothetical protein GWI33_009288 [Rhynchophorus ferrugineus]|uniref:Uncharacterized protein n=1 Tax=Rhynchophorus ferrugineus TaxID=354439 RepID=A0A834IAU1_RHYFE|nr:hypothetical protein GWI33_009288 [Rhynchophorus ferrugineus]